MEAATDERIAAHVSSPLDDLPPIIRRVAADALEDGEATYRSVHEPSVHDQFVRSDAGYYRLTVEAGDHVETTGYRYEVAFGDDVATPTADDRVTDFADLPSPDRDAFLAALGAKSEAIRSAEGAGFGVFFAYPDAETRDRSAFVPPVDTLYVRWQGKTMRVTFAQKRPATVVTYAVTAERVARSTAALVDWVLEQRGVVLDGLSADQRDIVESAIDGGYDACEPYSDAFSDLLDRLSTGEHDFASFVRYEGRWYISQVSQWVE